MTTCETTLELALRQFVSAGWTSVRPASTSFSATVLRLPRCFGFGFAFAFAAGCARCWLLFPPASRAEVLLGLLLALRPLLLDVLPLVPLVRLLALEAMAPQEEANHLG